MSTAKLAARKHARSDEEKLRRRRKAQASKRRRVELAEERRRARRRARRARGEEVCWCDAYPFPHRKGSEGAASSGTSQQVAAAVSGFTARDRLARKRAELEARKRKRAVRSKRVHRTIFGGLLPF